MALAFGWSQVEAALAAVHKIEVAKRGAFTGRLRHLQADGFPRGVQVGKGRRASYTFAHVMQTALALELMQAGTGPSRIKGLVEGSWQALASNMIDMLKNPALTAAWVIRPMALADLNAAPDERYADGFEIVDKGGVGDLLRADGFIPTNGVTWRVLALDGRQVLSGVYSALKAVAGDLDLVACYQDLQEEVTVGDDSETTMDKPKRGAAPKLASDLSRRKRKAPVETV